MFKSSILQSLLPRPRAVTHPQLHRGDAAAARAPQRRLHSEPIGLVGLQALPRPCPGAGPVCDRQAVPGQQPMFATPVAQPAQPTALPTALPASTDPSIWAHMAPYLQKSPYLAKLVQNLAAEGWTVQWTPSVSFCTPSQRVIGVQLGSGLAGALIDLAHEAQHASDKISTEPGLYPDEGTYFDALMESEVNANLSQLLVRDEIQRNAGVDIGTRGIHPWYMDAALRFYQTHGDQRRLRNHFRQMLTWATTGLSGQTYLQTYVNAFRQSRGHPPLSLAPQMDGMMQARALHQLVQEIGQDWQARARPLSPVVNPPGLHPAMVAVR